MINHTLTLILATFILYTNAQVIVSPINSSIPKTIKSKEIGVNSTLNNKIQKSFTQVGTFHSTFYIKSLIPNLDSMKTDIYPLIPDTCLRVFIDNKEDTTIGYMGFGFNFDPYSESFSESLDKGIFPNPSEYSYNYRLDTLSIGGAYFAPKFDSLHPDTLRIYVSYYEVYRLLGRYTNYYLIHYLTDPNSDTLYLAPIVKITEYDKPKGGVIKPVVDNTITINYILSEKDISRTWDSLGKTWYNYTNIVIPLTHDSLTENGYEIPGGDVLSVMPTFIPGYNYQLGDTLYFGLTDPNDSATFGDGYPIRINNYFAMSYSYMDLKEKYFADPFGYNNAIIAYKELLYQLYQSTSFHNSCYYPNLQLLPDISFIISADSYNIAVNETNKIIPIIYPNPANDNITIQLKNSDPATISIINILGQEVKSTLSNNLQTTMHISDLKAGMYFVRIDQKGKRFTSKISIQ